jgi:hypothetical protein
MRHAVFPWLVLGNLALAGGIVAALLAPARAQENRLPPGPGRDAVIAACSDCHGLVALDGKHMSYGVWYTVIGDMMTNGASVSTPDREAIAGYLADNFGPAEEPQAAPAAAK